MIIKTPLADIVTTTYQGKILIKQNTLTVAMGLSKDISPTDSRLGKYINAFNAVTKIKSVRWLDAQKVVEGILPQFLNGYLGEIRGSPSRQQFCKNTPTFIFQNTKAVLDILKEKFSMHNLKPIKTIITPNGTKLGVYKENGKLFYGVARLAKALGFSQFANDSTLAMAFKYKDFYCGFKQISGGSARVGYFNQLAPLLEYFIKLTLNITPNNSSQGLVLDTARMEAQRLIELLTGKPADTPKQSVMEDLRDNPYFVKPQQEEKTKPVVEAMNLFDEEPPAKTNTQSGIVVLPQPLNFVSSNQTPEGCKLKLYSGGEHTYVTLKGVYGAIHNSNTSPNSVLRKKWIEKGIPIYRARANDRCFNTDDHMAHFVRLDEVAKVFPQIANWLKKDEVPTMTENNPAEKTKTIGDKEEMLIRELLNLRQEKFSRQIAGIDKQIAIAKEQDAELEAQLQALEQQQEKLLDHITALERERADTIDQFNRKQKLFEEMFS